MRLEVDLIILPARRGDNALTLPALLPFRSATFRMIAISFGEIAPLGPLAADRGDLYEVVIIDFLGAKDSLLEDLDDLLLILVLDFVDFRAEGPTGVSELLGFAHCIIVLRRNLLFSF